MTEPATTSGTAGIGLGASLVAILGPAAGPGAAIVFGALAGAMWPLAKRHGLTKAQGGLLVLRLVLTSVALTGALALWLEEEYQIPAMTLLSPISFGIAFIGDRWTSVSNAFARRLEDFVSGKGRTDE